LAADSVSQVEGLGTILDTREGDDPKKDDRRLAYALAMTYHEAAFHHAAIHEKGSSKYFFYMYVKDGSRPKVSLLLLSVRFTFPVAALTTALALSAVEGGSKGTLATMF
jgi:hypothetical protein